MRSLILMKPLYVRLMLVLLRMFYDFWGVVRSLAECVYNQFVKTNTVVTEFKNQTELTSWRGATNTNSYRRLSVYPLIRS